MKKQKKNEETKKKKGWSIQYDEAKKKGWVALEPSS